MLAQSFIIFECIVTNTSCKRKHTIDFSVDKETSSVFDSNLVIIVAFCVVAGY